ncbi:MAG: hypothetical protein ABW133_07245 [Polyangiaceae bacterium]
MTTAPPPARMPATIAGPLRRVAGVAIGIFIAVQIGLVVRATVPLFGKGHGPWPWRMFERRSPWERELLATGIDSRGGRSDLPLSDIFRYARGKTRLYGYHQIEALGDPNAVAGQAAFAAFVARRSAELGIEVTAVDLRWKTTNLDTGETEERPIGVFGVATK